MSRRLSLLLILLAIVIIGAIYWFVLELNPPAGISADLREAVTPTALEEIAAVPVPETLPMLPGEGEDRWGYPRATVDQLGLLSLLRARRFADLTQYLHTIEQAFESDPKKELWVEDALSAFASADPMLEPLLDAWVEQASESFAPYAARGAYFVQRGFHQRGRGWLGDTRRGQVTAMHASHARARSDLERSIQLRPRLVAARTMIIRTAKADGHDVSQVFAEALAACPTCLAVRTERMLGLRPRWAGSVDAMRELAEDAQAHVAANPRLAVLRGYVDWEECDVQWRDPVPEGEERQFDLGPCDRSLVHGDHWDFNFARAKVRVLMDDIDGAQNDFDVVAAQRPQQQRVLHELLQMHGRRHEFVRAAVLLADRMRLDATTPNIAGDRDYVSQGLRWAAWQAIRANDRQAATAAVSHLREISPSDPRAANVSTAIAMMPTREAVARAEAGVEERPEDFDAHVLLDGLWMRLNRGEDVVTMWDRYIDAHPGNGPAYLERGGTHYQLHHTELAARDARRACELGVQEGCQRAAQFR